MIKKLYIIKLMMEHTFKTLNKVKTHLITWGEPFASHARDVIICVSGNPGVPDFYIEFGSALHSNTEIPVIVIGHAGHYIIPEEERSDNQLNKNEDLFDLKAQLKHKLDLINNHINKDCKVHLIGHSIGSWMILELLNLDDKLVERISSVNLLFPTIQKMAETKNGFILNNYTRKLHLLVLSLVTFLNLFPDAVILFFISLYIKFNSLPLHYSHRIKTFLSTQVVGKVLYLAYNEMDLVTSLNHKSLNKVKHITNVIYSTRDDWVPLEYMNDLNQYKPLIQMREVNVNHAFVLKSSERVAEWVSDFIKTKIA